MVKRVDVYYVGHLAANTTLLEKLFQIAVSNMLLYSIFQIMHAVVDGLIAF